MMEIGGVHIEVKTMHIRSRPHELPKAISRNLISGENPTFIALQSTAGADTLIQRKAACPCGGGCPDCRQESSLQTSLQIAAAGDQYEQEADRVADQVMRMPEQRVQRQALDEKGGRSEAADVAATESALDEEEEEDEVLVQPKLRTGKSNQRVTQAVRHNLGSFSGRGEPLSAASQAFFASRMGYDFSQVRIHRGSHAAEMTGALNARAFTLGNDVVFNRGEYAPHSADGKRLLAHELTHVIQQQKFPMLQRKIVTPGGHTIGNYLTKKGVTYSSNGVRYAASSTDSSTLDKEILSTMLVSGRNFYVAGSTQPDTVNNLDEHVKTRKRIIKFTAMKNYHFPRFFSPHYYNPRYFGYIRQGGRKYHYMRNWVKRRKKQMDAYLDLIKSGLYSVYCHTATLVTMLAGTNNVPLHKDQGVADGDWVPGDWGYVRNNTFSSRYSGRGTEGENIIYVGKKKYWGHISSAITYKTLPAWKKFVERWAWVRFWKAVRLIIAGKPLVKVMSHRRRPTNGLIQ